MLRAMAGPLWQPSGERIEAAALTAFRRRVEVRHAVTLPDYASLHAWSLREPDAARKSIKFHRKIIKCYRKIMKIHEISSKNHENP